MKPTNNRQYRVVKQKKQDRAVSPVIGVILMVAITVILAAVIGVFVMGMGAQLGDGSAPTVTLSLDDGENDGEFEIRHQSGEVLALSEEVSVVWEGTSIDSNDVMWADDELAAGERTTVNISDHGGVAGETGEIRLRHDPSASIIASGEVEIGSDN